MSHMKLTYVSDAIKDMVNLYVAIPQKKHVRSAASPEIQLGSFQKEYPVLILLHDEASSPVELYTQTCIERLADEAGVLVAMPEGMLSYYSNYATRDACVGNGGTGNASIEANFTELCHENNILEVLDIVRHSLPGTCDPARTAIAGIGMGGFGALKIAAKHPDLFGAVATVDAIADLQLWMDTQPGRAEQFEAVFGGQKAEGENDLPAVYRALAAQENAPRVLQLWNRQDPHAAMNESFQKAVEGAYPHYTAQALDAPGGWEQVEACLKQLLHWL